ncbi:MAG: hypothetical protein LBH72_05915 [Proteiniphilum sp.]|jgi:hypothetical protein|nr:hypothetical protein [Proteiniphilum sp.]
MGTIRFDSPFNREVFIRSNRIFWNYTWRKAKKLLWIYVVFFVIFTGLWILNGAERGYLFLLMLISFCGLFSSCIRMFTSGKTHTEKTKKQADFYEKADSIYIIEISEESVTFQDFQASINLKWSEFEYYTVYKEHIILIPHNYYISGGLLIDKNVAGEKYTQALEFLKDRLTYRKA